ncbi:hypothetical protein K432DRAFT_400006 [Lepidopterella palustris CBS 459.81]|uniref:Uncharacterized protein n=1 Tax=Lepidopterella palustris CBS 459.81 TaxID=1314670 RepID=A0A8E2EKL3_9PEZI|nr:hypothetical protein K432DRAFT_400006 [Lepidopterella palustris CBS 459.81]
MEDCARDKYLMYKQIASLKKITILGTFGCSLEILVAISQVFDVVLDMDNSTEVPRETIDKLER